MDYGLWLLIGLLVVIALIFLLSGKGGKAADSAAPDRPATAVAPPAPLDPAPIASTQVAPPPVAVVPVEPVVAEPVIVAPIAVEPASVAPPVAEPLIEQPAQPIAAPTPPPTQPVAPASPAVTAMSDAGDDLLRLKGVGPKLRSLLIDLGVTRYAQIAAWTDTDISTIDAKLGTFKGRPVRDQWVDQAKYLAAGDIAGFEAKYGKL